MLKMWKNIGRKQRTTTNFTAHNKLYVYQKWFLKDSNNIAPRASFTSLQLKIWLLKKEKTHFNVFKRHWK